MTNSLVIAPQWIGDAVMTEPLLRRLAMRGERLTVGALPWVAPVYRAMGAVDEVIELPFAHGGLQLGARRALGRAWRGRFDVAYVLPNSIKSALLPAMAGIPKRLGYVGEGRWGLLNQRWPNPVKGQRPPMVAFYSALSGAQDVANDVPLLTLAPVVRTQALARHGLAAQSYVVMVPGAEYGPAKRWPTSHFAALASALLAQALAPQPQQQMQPLQPFMHDTQSFHGTRDAIKIGASEPDLTVLLIGSGKESGLCDEIVAQLTGPAAQPGRVRHLAGKTSLDEAMALLAGARAVVSNDTGLMHVAAAFGVPQVALFGSSSPLHTPPLSALAQVIWLKQDAHYSPALDCAPCFARNCPLGHLRCLHDIEPKRVLGALLAARPLG